jgi:PAS domain S-box-containing protein
MVEDQDWRRMRESIIGLGDGSSRKSFYPELRKRLEELEEAQERLRLSEQNLRAIFDHTHDGFFIHDLEGRVLDVNATVLAMFGLTREEACSLHIPAILAPRTPEEDVRSAQQARMERLVAQEHMVVEVLALRPRDGSTFDAEVGLDLVQWNGERCVVATVRDITDRKRLEGMLRQSQKLDALGQLAGGVAHDTNNMLGVIIGYVEMLFADETLGDVARRDLEQIHKAAVRSSELSRQLLAFARQQAIQPRAVDLDELVEGSTTLLRRLIGENLQLVWEPGSRPWTTWIDPSQVDQVLANLVVNARDAIQGQGRILLRTSRTQVDEAYCAGRLGARPGEYLVLTVSDDGSGMSAETLSHIFEPFFTTKAPGRGTGLGLATVYGIVTQNQGFITVYSEPGRGTAFRLHFPRHAGGPDAVEPTDTSTHRGSETVLVVEDEPSLLELAERLLVTAGYQVLATSSPLEALQLAQAHAGPIHLLLTDLVMPEMDGGQLCRLVTPLRPQIKVLFMSGYPADTLARHMILAEDIQFLQKPFRKQDLLRMVRRTLDGPG